MNALGNKCVARFASRNEAERFAVALRTNVLDSTLNTVVAVGESVWVSHKRSTLASYTAGVIGAFKAGWKASQESHGWNEWNEAISPAKKSIAAELAEDI